MIAIKKVILPEFGRDEVPPEMPFEIYRTRLQAAREQITARDLDILLVYADREHFANLTYLTGVDPRFEEELLLLDRAGRGLFLTGNECMGYLPDERLGLKVELFQDFSLMGQQRDSSRPLKEILSGFGILRGKKVGCAGSKVYDRRLSGDPQYASDLPGYILDLLRELTGDPRNVTNVTDIFTDPARGLRIVNIEPEQIAVFEYAAVQTSMAMLDAMRHIEPGMREDVLEKYLESAGLPLSCHRTIGFGLKARRGLASPNSNKAAVGDVYKMGLGVVGSLTARNGFIARGPQDVPEDCRDFYARFAANYFDMVASWYEHLKIGATGGDVFQAVESRRDKAILTLLVNPGHYLHLDEWVHSPFSPGSTIQLRSGMALQADIIPVSKGPFCKSNVEDGVVLADEKLRSALAAKFPACSKRMQMRRDFMANSLGIRLHESVLPLSNMPAYLPPYVLSLDQVFVKT